MKLVNIGFGNMVNASRLVAIVSPESAPIKRIIQECKEKGIKFSDECVNELKVITEAISENISTAFS